MEPTRRVLAQFDMPRSALRRLAEYVRTYYLAPNRSIKGIVFKESDEGYEYAFNVPLSEIGGPPSNEVVDVRLIFARKSVEAAFALPAVQDARADAICSRVSDDIELVVDNFTTRAKRTNVYFVFSPENHALIGASSPRNENPGRQVLRRVFKGNTLNVYLVLLVLAFVFMLFLGNSAIVGLLAIQAIVLFYSDRFAMGVGDVHPSREKPAVTLVSVRTSPETASTLRKHGKALLPKIRDHVSAAVAKGGDSVPAIRAAFNEYGIPCAEDDVKVVERDVYRTVQDVAAKFHMPVPKISIDNTPLDNASATGVSPSRSSITITAGAVEELDDEQLQAVVGHELGHVKGRDPIILFFVTSLVYLGGFYLWLPLLLSLGLLYFLLAFGVIYAVGKLLETRADTESAIVLGQPGKLAAALTKIGFRQLYYEKYSTGLRILDWLRFDPHPPTYFRVHRLSRIAEQRERISHAFLVSLRDCLLGFGRALVGLD